jgi:pimeloyl-ACP methyl ester carboxylesterase
MHYRIEGEGEPVLLLHMAMASSDEYTRVIPFLSKTHCVVALDFLGHGDSVPAPYPYQILDHVRSVVSFMDSLGIKKASVVGHHFGAAVAIEFAITSPERMNKLILSSPGYWRDEGERIAAIKNPPDFTTRVEIREDGSHLIEWWRRSAMWGDPPEIVEERVIEFIKAGPRGAEVPKVGFPYNPKPRLPLINCPTLVLSATRDPGCSVAEDVKKLIPRRKLTIIENGPLSIDRVMPKEFAEAILSFLDTPKI